MASFPNRLSPLQHDLLREFFAREKSFFLTGGGALVGFYLGHRETEDLDIFSPPGTDLDGADRAVRAAASACGATVQVERAEPDFKRVLVRRGEESTLVDMVVDRAPMVDSIKPEVDGIRIDTLREIAANKICTLVGRNETKDLRDMRELLKQDGIDLRSALDDAALKEGGADAGTLAWVLESFPPSSSEPLELREFRKSLAKELREIEFERAAKG
jgi:predicted nucleotidyltransferase component of viral defense system